MTARPATVTATDVALLRYLAQEGSIVAASRRAGISRDRANYRLARLASAFGGPTVVSVRGGLGHGRTRLTPLGDRIVRQGFDAVELLESRPVAPIAASNLLHGAYRTGPPPTVAVGGGVEFRVTFRAEEGERVGVLVDPEAILLARQRFVSSARNVFPAAIQTVRRNGRAASSMVTVRVGPVRLRVAVTDETIRELRLRAGGRTWVYLKATSLRRAGGARSSAGSSARTSGGPGARRRRSPRSSGAGRRA